MSSSSNNAGLISIAFAARKPRREVIFLFPCYPRATNIAQLQKVVDANGVIVKSNALWRNKYPELYQIAGIPDRITDAQCHGAQIELWISLGASLRRDIMPRITGIQRKGDLGWQQEQLGRKLIKRRQDYRRAQQAGLQHKFDARSKQFASIMSNLSVDQLILASPRPIDLDRKVMINPRSNPGDEEPLFKPMEVPQGVRDALNTCRAMSAAEKAAFEWGTVPADPPTLAEWLRTHPEFNDNDLDAGEEHDDTLDAEGCTDSETDPDDFPLSERDHLFNAIVDKLFIDKERYRSAYTGLVEGKIGREKFENEVAECIIVGDAELSGWHEQLMQYHGGEVWQYVDIDTFGRDPNTNYDPGEGSFEEKMLRALSLLPDADADLWD